MNWERSDDQMLKMGRNETLNIEGEVGGECWVFNGLDKVNRGNEGVD
jgi:hypothetical protein